MLTEMMAMEWAADGIANSVCPGFVHLDDRAIYSQAKLARGRARLCRSAASPRRRTLPRASPSLLGPRAATSPARRWLSMAG